MAFIRWNTPLGIVRVVTESGRICMLKFEQRREDYPDRPDKLCFLAKEQLNEYFAGQRREFTLPLRPQGTPFQCSVWEAVQSVPYGQTRTYREIGLQIGRPTASRAVGAAVGKNPIWLLIPCHRIIGSDGSLTGYAGGLQRKESLLELERSGLLTENTQTTFIAAPSAVH